MREIRVGVCGGRCPPIRDYTPPPLPRLIYFGRKKLINWIFALSCQSGQSFSTAFPAALHLSSTRRGRREPGGGRRGVGEGSLTCCSWRGGRRRAAARPGSAWPPAAAAAGTATASRGASPPRNPRRRQGRARRLRPSRGCRGRGGRRRPRGRRARHCSIPSSATSTAHRALPSFSATSLGSPLP